MQERYILLAPDEDGKVMTLIDPEELTDIQRFKEDYGVESFLADWSEEEDPQYWPEGTALLLKARVVRVKPVKVVETWELDDSQG